MRSPAVKRPSSPTTGTFCAAPPMNHARDSDTGALAHHARELERLVEPALAQA